MFFKKIDTLSPKITLFFFNQTSHSNIISGILTLIIYLIYIICLIYFSLDLILHRNETSNFYNRTIKDAGIFSMKDSLFHFITFINLIVEPNTIQIIGLEQILFSDYIEDGKRENFNHYIYSFCTKEMRNKLKKEISNNIEDSYYDNNSFCIDSFYNSTSKKITKYTESNFTYPSISHGTNNPNYTYYGIIIQKCINSTLNNFSCDTSENIDKKLFKLGMHINLINYDIDIKNYKNPIVNYFIHIGQSYSPLNIAINHLNFQPLKIISYEGLIFYSINEKQIFKYEQNEKQVWKTEFGIIGGYYFWMQNNALIYERKYKRIQNIIVDFGGIINGFYLIGYFLNWIIYQFTLLNDINQLLCYFIDSKNKKQMLNNINIEMFSSSMLNLNSNFNSGNIKQLTINKHKDEQNSIIKNINQIKNNNFYKLKKSISFSGITFYSFFKWIIYCYPFRSNKTNKLSYIYNIYKQFISEETMFFIILRTKEFLKANVLKEFNFSEKSLFIHSKSLFK